MARGINSESEQGIARMKSPEVAPASDTDIKTQRPHMYNVVLMNDDYTPMDFVVKILKKFFHKSHEDAVNIMLKVHHKGMGKCGVFTKDVAETKVEQVLNFTKKYDHPLKCGMEKE
jgi:ATP-dependent Clp protease adaptor protein ClpS